MSLALVHLTHTCFAPTPWVMDGWGHEDVCTTRVEFVRQCASGHVASCVPHQFALLLGGSGETVGACFVIARVCFSGRVVGCGISCDNHCASAVPTSMIALWCATL